VKLPPQAVVLLRPHCKKKMRRCRDLSAPHHACLYHFVVAVWSAKKDRIRRVKYWEIKSLQSQRNGWSWGCIPAIDSNGQTIWIADAHRDDEKPFVVRADEKLSVFLELESAIQAAES
jgi:hypothetical protein